MLMPMLMAKAQEEPQPAFVAWSPDGSTIAVGSGDTLQILDTSMNVLNTFTGLETQNAAAAWHPNGNEIILANGRNAEIWDQPWDPNSAQQIGTLAYSGNYIFSLTWSPDGSKIAIANVNADVWDANTQQILYSLTAHEFFVTHIAWSPDGSLLATTSLDRHVNVWNATDGSLINSMLVATTGSSPGTDRAATLSVSWSPDSSRLVFSASDGTVRIWDRTILNAAELMSQDIDLNVFHGHEGAVWSVSWSPAGNQIASGGDDGTVRIWDMSTGEQLQIVEVGAPVRSVDWNNDGSRLAYIGSGMFPQVIAAPNTCASNSDSTPEAEIICPTPTVQPTTTPDS
jgi:WD40 repeat protein